MAYNFILADRWCFCNPHVHTTFIRAAEYSCALDIHLLKKHFSLLYQHGINVMMVNSAITLPKAALPLATMWNVAFILEQVDEN